MCDFWCARIAKYQAIIESLEDGILQLEGGIVQSYTLDTGQTRQTVQRSEVSSLKNSLRYYMSTLDDLSARVCGHGAARYLRPL